MIGLFTVLFAYFAKSKFKKTQEMYLSFTYKNYVWVGWIILLITLNILN